MDESILIFASLMVGYFMGSLSMIAGACLMSKATKDRTLFPDLLEPKGDAFTVETPDDMTPYPEDVVNEAEEHILKKTNDFLKSFSTLQEESKGGK